MIRRWLYHPDGSSRIFEDGDIERFRNFGWYDSPKLFPKKDEPVTPVKRSPGRPPRKPQ